MKLSLVHKYENTGFEYLNGSVVCGETIILLTINKNNRYELLFLSGRETAALEIPYLDTFLDITHKPVLFAQDNYFGIIKNPAEIFLYKSKDAEPEPVSILGETLPVSARLSYQNPVSNNNILPVCFEKDLFTGQPRQIALLEMDCSNKKAQWKSWTNLDADDFPYHRDKQHSPKIDSAMIMNDALYIFTSGGSITAVNKWGMDYFALVKSGIDGTLKEILLDSGDLSSAQKKKGVNGIFSSSGQYILLTPLFQNDEWKGKQKIFSMQTRTLTDFDFPRGSGKYPQLIQQHKDTFLVYLRDTKELATCKES